MPKLSRVTPRLLVLSAVVLSTACSSYYRLGDLNMVSTRNIDSSADYELVARYQTAKVRAKEDSLQAVIDKVVRDTPGGEYAMNVKIFVKQNGRKVKVEADVWGFPPPRAATTDVGVTQSVSAHVELRVGDWVSWSSRGKELERGRIIGLNADGAVVAVDGGERIVSQSFDDLTKIEPPAG